MSKPATQSMTAAASTSGGQAISPRMATQAASGRQHQRRPQPKMGQRRESLGVAVAEQEQQHRHGGVQRNPVARQKQQRAGRRIPASRPTVNAATAATLSAPLGRCRCRVRGFSASSRRSARRLKAIAALRAVAMQTQDAQQIEPAEGPGRDAPRVGRPRHRRRQQRKRQRKQRMAEADHFQELADAAEEEAWGLGIERIGDDGMQVQLTASAVHRTQSGALSSPSSSCSSCSPLLLSILPSAGSASSGCPVGRRFARRRNRPGRGWTSRRGRSRAWRAG